MRKEKPEKIIDRMIKRKGKIEKKEETRREENGGMLKVGINSE